MASLAKRWLVAEDGEADYVLLERACRHIHPCPVLHRVIDGFEAQRYLSGVDEFADRTIFPLPALILSDVRMPRLDGIELLAWVKSEPSISAIPFVLMTSSPLDGDRKRAYALGAAGYLIKKPNPAHLVIACIASEGERMPFRSGSLQGPHEPSLPS